MTTSKKYQKPQYKTESIKLDNGSTVQIQRTPLANLDLLLDLQDKLLEQYIACDGNIGMLFKDEQVVNDLTIACNLLPIVGKDETLQFEDICENWEQIILLFFNGGLNPDTRRTDNIMPSRVSQLHFLPFGEMLMKHVKAIQEQKKESENS